MSYQRKVENLSDKAKAARWAKTYAIILGAHIARIDPTTSLQEIANDTLRICALASAHRRLYELCRHQEPTPGQTARYHRLQVQVDEILAPYGLKMAHHSWDPVRYVRFDGCHKTDLSHDVPIA